MADKERNALIPLPAGGLENIGSGPKSILSGMVSDALALAKVREKTSSDTQQQFKEKLLRLYPGMTEQEAQQQSLHPPKKNPEPMSHEFQG